MTAVDAWLDAFKTALFVVALAAAICAVRRLGGPYEDPSDTAVPIRVWGLIALQGAARRPHKGTSDTAGRP